MGLEAVPAPRAMEPRRCLLKQAQFKSQWTTPNPGHFPTFQEASKWILDQYILSLRLSLYWGLKTP